MFRSTGGGPRISKNRKKKQTPKDDDELTGPSTPQSTNETTSEVATAAGKENGLDGYVNGDGLDVDEVGEAADRAPGAKLLDHGRLLRLSGSSEDLAAFHQHWQSSLPVCDIDHHLIPSCFRPRYVPSVL